MYLNMQGIKGLKVRFQGSSSSAVIVKHNV